MSDDNKCESCGKVINMSQDEYTYCDNCGWILCLDCVNCNDDNGEGMEYCNNCVDELGDDDE